MTTPVQQVETATVVGSVTGDGNAKVTITSALLATSPLVVAVAVLNGDTAADVAGKVRTAAAFNATVAAPYQVSGTLAAIVLTARKAAANDTTLNIAIANDTCTGLTAAPTSTNTVAGAGLDHAYITLEQIKTKDALDITDSTSDADLVDAINAVSRAVEDHCGRRFWKNSADETRYYTAEDPDELFPGDLLSITTLKTDAAGDRTYADTWAGTDYDLFPYSAALSNRPYYGVSVTPQGLLTFPVGMRKGVQITGVFGWAAVPAPVEQACLLWSMRAWYRHKTVLGTSATNALGTMQVRVPPPDPDVIEMLKPYCLALTGSLL